MRLTIFFLLLGLILGCSDDERTAAPTTPELFDELYSTGSCNFDIEPGIRVARTEDELFELMNEGCIRVDASEVDFGSQMVLVYFMGTRVTGGHFVRFENIRRGFGGVTCDVYESRPGSTCVVTSASISPTGAIAITTSSGAVEVKVRGEVHQCGP